MPSMDPGYLDPSKQLDSVCFLGSVRIVIRVPAAYSTLVDSTVWQISGMILRMPPHSFYEIASIYRNLAPLIQAIEL